MSYIVALTGGIGSGKTTVANAFAQLGVAIVDADIIARQVVEKGTAALTAIVQRFGQSILQNDGALNRAALRNIIFNDVQQKSWLNALLHPLIQQQTLRQFEQISAAQSVNSLTTAPYILWVIPLLIENKLTAIADRILLIDVEPQIQLARAIQRDGSNRQVVESIIHAQASRTERLSNADDIIDNSGNSMEIPAIVAELHQRYLQLAAEKERNSATDRR